MIVVDPGRIDPVVRLAQPLYAEVLRNGLPALRAAWIAARHLRARERSRRLGSTFSSGCRCR